MSKSNSSEAGRRLQELRRSGAAGKHDTRPRGERSRRDIKRKEIERQKEDYNA